MALAFAQSMRVLEVDRGRWSLAGLGVLLGLLGMWGAWAVLARVPLYVVTPTARVALDPTAPLPAVPLAGWGSAPQGNTLRVVADFPLAVALGRVQPGQAAWLQRDGVSWAQNGSVAATVRQVTHNAQDGVLRVELQLHSDIPMALPWPPGLPVTVGVAVEHLSPATLVLRAIGQRLGVLPQSAVSGPQQAGPA